MTVFGLIHHHISHQDWALSIWSGKAQAWSLHSVSDYILMRVWIQPTTLYTGPNSTRENTSEQPLRTFVLKDKLHPNEDTFGVESHSTCSRWSCWGRWCWDGSSGVAILGWNLPCQFWLIGSRWCCEMSSLRPLYGRWFTFGWCKRRIGPHLGLYPCFDNICRLLATMDTRSWEKYT